MIPTILWILAAIAGYVLSVVFPLLPQKKVKRDEGAALKRLRARMPAGESEEFLSARAEYRKGERIRVAVWSGCALVWVASAIASAVYLFQTAHFRGVNFNTEVLAMVKNVFPWFGASFLVSCGAVIFELFYAKKSLPKLKKLIALGKGAPTEPPSKLSVKRSAAVAFLQRENVLVSIRLALLVLGTVFVVVGMFHGGMAAVLKKAINICTECIGLG